MKSAIAALLVLFASIPNLAAAPATRSEANDAYQYDRHEDAIRLFSELLERQPAAPDADLADFHFKRAYAFYHLQRFDEARYDLLDALELGLLSAEAHNLLALVYSANGEPDLSVDHGLRAVELGRQHSPRNLNTYVENLIAYSLEFAERNPVFVKGQQALADQRYEDADAAFTAALAAYPTGAHVLACHLRRGLARLDLPDQLAALDDLQRAIELGGESAETLNNIGYAYFQMGNEIAAYDYFYAAFQRADTQAKKMTHKENADTVSRKLSAQADILHYQAQAALANGDIAAAHDLYAQAMLLPGGRSTAFLAGIVALSDRAIRDFDAQIAPLDQLSRTGEPAAILAEFQRLKQLLPHNTRLDFLREDAFFTLLEIKYPKAYSLLGKAQNVRWGEWKKAIKPLNEAIKLAPDIPLLYLERATFLSNLKDPKALQDIDAAARLLGGETYLTHSRRGAFYRNTGDTARALESLNAALELKADAKDSWDMWTRDFFDAQQKNQPSPALAEPPTDRRSARQSAFELAQATPGSDASDRYVGLARTNHDLETSFLTNYPELNRRAADYSWAIILDPLNGDAYSGRAYCYDKVNDLDAALADFTRAKNVGSSDGSEGINMIWSKKATASVEAYLKGGGNATTTSSQDSSDATTTASRYCMRCSATGYIYVYEDDTDAYNHRVRVEKRKPCPECHGRGLR